MTRRGRLLRLPRGAESQQPRPSVKVIVANYAGEILLIRRTDNNNRAVPAGAIVLGESVAQPAVCVSLEESRSECAVTGIVGIYSDPKHLILYAGNGEARQEFSIVLSARPLSGQLTPGSESSERPVGPAVRAPRLRDGPVDAHPHQRLHRTQRDTGDHLAPRNRCEIDPHRRPVAGSAMHAPAANGPQNSDLTSDYGRRLRQTQRDDLRPSYRPDLQKADLVRPPGTKLKCMACRRVDPTPMLTFTTTRRSVSCSTVPGQGIQ